MALSLLTFFGGLQRDRREIGERGNRKERGGGRGVESSSIGDCLQVQGLPFILRVLPSRRLGKGEKVSESRILVTAEKQGH